MSRKRKFLDDDEINDLIDEDNDGLDDLEMEEEEPEEIEDAPEADRVFEFNACLGEEEVRE